MQNDENKQAQDYFNNLLRTYNILEKSCELYREKIEKLEKQITTLQKEKTVAHVFQFNVN